VRALLQRTTGARVRVDGEVIGAIGPGLVVFLGIGPADDETTADALARRVTELRIFEDDDGRTNRSLMDIGGQVLAISQFTLYADTRRGRRPGFTAAAPPDRRTPLSPICRGRQVTGRRRRDRGVRGGHGRRARQRRPVHDLAGHGGAIVGVARPHGPSEQIALCS
jgi:D-tyrosyl-tRNA(Tyr) deacylase